MCKDKREAEKSLPMPKSVSRPHLHVNFLEDKGP